MAKSPGGSVSAVGAGQLLGSLELHGVLLPRLRSLDFVVVVDQLMTATSEAAHLVLPCTTHPEMDDLVTAYGQNWMGVTRRAVAPCGECRTDGEILQGLAERLGVGEALRGTSDSWMERLLTPLAPAGVTLAGLRARLLRRRTPPVRGGAA